jgi:hypothetical protein
MKEKRPWWRHWHVTHHDPGYLLREAKEVQKYEEEHNPEYGPFEVTRCDIDHSAEGIGWIGLAGGGVVEPIRIEEA